MAMQGIFETFIKCTCLAKQHPRSLYGGIKNSELFNDIKTYCMFIGYPRSGHSVIGSLLDAHPNMVIAQELGALMYIHARFSRNQLFYLLLERSFEFTRGGRKWSGYSYKIPNQWQGKVQKLQIIGDKHGEGASLRLQARPWLLQRLQKTVGVNIKFIHVVRNPFDNISTISKKTKVNGKHLDLKESIEHYFSLCKTVATIKQRVDAPNVFEFRQESFINNPKALLSKLCNFLGVNAPNEYLTACADIVFKSPHKTRFEAEWSSDLIGSVKTRMNEFCFLQNYSYQT
jgi:hypothetical protein